jgi:hypothetical protein
MRSVRNFWVEAVVDGRRTKVAFGPRRADGGFELTVYQRDRGTSWKAATISGRVIRDGEALALDVETVLRFVTVETVR